MKLVPGYATKGKVDTIDTGVLIKDGGVLNCVSWSIGKLNVYYGENCVNKFGENSTC